MDSFIQYLQFAWQYIFDAISSNTIWQIVIAFIGGGYVASWMSERWQRKRDANTLLRANTAKLVRIYQRYTRLLRQDPVKRSEQELDFLHADFLAEIKIMQFESQFKGSADKMRVLAQRLANVRNGQSAAGTEKSKLNQVGRDFDILLKEILAKT